MTTTIDDLIRAIAREELASVLGTLAKPHTSARLERLVWAMRAAATKAKTAAAALALEASKRSPSRRA